MSLLLDLVYFFVPLSYKRDGRKLGSGVSNHPDSVCKVQQAERERISADIHDELGSGITAIMLLSELAKKKMKDPVPVELQRISSTAAELLDSMNALVWSMDSAYDSLESLVHYIKTWSIDYFENTSLDCSVIIPAEIPGLVVDGEKRRNIYLAVKESINNILKHAAATEVRVTIACGTVFKIHISDNGRGIDMSILRPFGTGIRNMKRRMKSIGGTCIIECDSGTGIWLEVPMRRLEVGGLV